MIHVFLIIALFTDTNPLMLSVSGKQAPGYFLISGIDQDSVQLIDNTGLPAISLPAGPNINHQPTPYGGFSYFDGNYNAYVVVNDQLRKVDTLRALGDYKTDFHEGYQTRGRRFVLLGTEIRTVNMSEVIQGASDAAQVIGAVIQEFDRYGRLSFEWRSLDHIPVDEATHDIDLTHNRIDYIHANAVTIDKNGNYILSCRNTDQIIKIDKASGSIVWKLGGSASRHNDFTFINDTQGEFVGFSHQHAPILTKEGELMLFDNGNLKGTQESRVVAYKLDEVTMTATKTWEYLYPSPTFSPTMGSVQQLENDNILIGWGTTQNGLVATEVDRSRAIHAEIRSILPLDFPYRVYKSVIGMTAVTNTVSDTRPLPFDNIDSTTTFTLLPTGLDRPQRVTIEKHSYKPHQILFNTKPPCSVFNNRWIVAFDQSTTNTYEAYIDVSRTVAEDDPNDVVVYYRPQEGVGEFLPLYVEAVEASASIKVRPLLPGEYIIGTELCREPQLLYPGNDQDLSTTSMMLSWTGAIGADGYEVEVSPTPEFMQDVVFLRTQRPDTTIKNLQPNTTYYWHVRVIREPEVGPWTQTWKFDIMTPSQVAGDTPSPVFPIGTEVVIYDVLGNEIMRYRVQQESNHIELDIRDKLLLMVAHMPSGTTVRKIVTQ